MKYGRPLSGIVTLLVAAAAHSGALAHSAPEPATAEYFRDAAKADVDAAWRLLQDNHPGVVPALHDDAFIAALNDARRVGLVRAQTVSTPGGYLATMRGFANGLGDGHLRFTPQIEVARPNWVGLVIGLRAGQWTVVDENIWPDREPLKGAVLSSCDGRDADAVAAERLGQFRADWSIPAQRGLAAPWLLVDDGNPFLRPLKSCTFHVGSGDRTIAMDWTLIDRDAIAWRLDRASGAGAAGYGVRPFGSGWWIALGGLMENAPAVVAAARAHQDALRAAPYVVIDLRGNHGGSSALGIEIATTIYGTAAADPDGNDEDCQEAWRVSSANAAQLKTYITLLGPRFDAEQRYQLQRDVSSMKAAAAAGRSFSRPINKCTVRRRPQPIASKPRLFVITDRVCFSSCLILVEHYRALGAIQVGEATNGNTRYQENRAVTLPSGLGSFSTQAAVDMTEPPRVGPFEPTIRYPGDLTDTAALEAWMARVVSEDIR